MIAKKVNALWADNEFRSALSFQWENAPRNDEQYNVYVSIIKDILLKHKMGQYDRLSRVIFILNQIGEGLNQILFNELVAIKGIGPKTAAFFLLHSRREANIPVIDTHICKYMATKGIEMKVTSSLNKYMANAELVKKAIMEDFPNKYLAEADLYLWTKFSGRGL